VFCASSCAFASPPFLRRRVCYSYRAFPLFLFGFLLRPSRPRLLLLPPFSLAGLSRVPPSPAASPVPLPLSCPRLARGAFRFFPFVPSPLRLGLCFFLCSLFLLFLFPLLCPGLGPRVVPPRPPAPLSSPPAYPLPYATHPCGCSLCFLPLDASSKPVLCLPRTPAWPRGSLCLRLFRPLCSFAESFVSSARCFCGGRLVLLPCFAPSVVSVVVFRFFAPFVPPCACSRLP